MSEPGKAPRSRPGAAAAPRARARVLYPGAIALLVGVSACAAEDQTFECPIGQRVESNGLDVCVIQETGIGVVTRSKVCPPEFPFLHTLDAMLVCSAEAQLPEAVVTDLVGPQPADACGGDCPPVLEEVPVEVGPARAIAVTASALFCVDAEGALLSRVGGATEELARVGEVTQLAANEQWIYWISDGGRLRAATYEGDSDASLDLPIDPAADLAADATHVYWLEGKAGGRTRRLERSSGKVQDLGAAGGGVELGLAQGPVWWRTQDGGVRRALASGDGPPDDAAVSGAVALGTGPAGTFIAHESGYAWPIEGGEAFQHLNLPVGDTPTYLAVGVSHVWWASAGIVARSTADGQVRVIAPTHPGLFVSGGGRVAWSRQGAVMVAPLD